MAPFNPNIQEQNGPGVQNIGRIYVPENIQPQGVKTNTIMPQGVQEGNKAAAYAGQAAAAGTLAGAYSNAEYADIFKDTVSTADFLGKAGVQMVKKDIEDKVYDVADKERQAYTDLLEKIKSGVGVKNVLDAYAQGDDNEDPNNPGSPGMPTDLRSLPDTLGTLQSARDSGKISGTYYESKLLAEAKSLRAQYPGFREYIDQEFSKITGSNPANAYVRSLVQDINRATVAQQSTKNKMLSYILQRTDFPDAQKIFHDYQAGNITDEDVIKWAAPYEQQKYQLNMRALQFQDNNNTRADKQRIAGDNIDYASGVTVGRAVDSLMASIGLKTPDDVQSMVDKNNNGTITPKQWAQFGQQVEQARNQLRIAMINDADKTGYTKAVGGKAEVIKRVDAALAPFDNIRDRVYNHDFGGLYSVQQELKAQNDETKKAMLDDPKIGPTLRTSQALKDIGGENNLQKFQMQILQGDYPNDFKAWFQKSSQEMQTQYTMRTSGVPYTFNDAIDNLKKNNVNNVQLNKAVFNEINKITDPTVPEAVKMNYAMAAFSEGNRGMISRLQADGVDDKGRHIQGQNAVFQKFTSPEMTKAMWTLGQKEPQVWTNYVNWAKETIGSELMNREINDLKTIPENAGVRVDWDPKNHRFNTVDTRDRETQFYQDRALGKSATAPGVNSYYNTVRSSVERMNSQIYNYKRIAEASGQDVDAFVIKTIADAAGPDALRNVNGIPYGILRDIGLGRLKNGGQ